MKIFRGRLIAFSGIDGAGKSTQIQYIQKTLREKGRKTVYLWTRGGYTGPFNSLKGLLRRLLGKRLPPAGRTQQREKVLNNKRIKIVWLSLAMLDLILVYGVYARLLKWMGRVVIADRYLWDTWIDFKLNFPRSGFDQWILWKLLKLFSPKPDHFFLLLVPIEESLRRSKLKNEPFPDTKEVLQKRLSYYYRFSESMDWHVLHCMRPIDNIAEEIAEICNSRFDLYR